jgi:hypothetical protein
VPQSLTRSPGRVVLDGLFVLFTFIQITLYYLLVLICRWHDVIICVTGLLLLQHRKLSRCYANFLLFTKLPVTRGSY